MRKQRRMGERRRILRAEEVLAEAIANSGRYGLRFRRQGLGLTIGDSGRYEPDDPDRPGVCAVGAFVCGKKKLPTKNAYELFTAMTGIAASQVYVGNDRFVPEQGDQDFSWDDPEDGVGVCYAAYHLGGDE